MPVATKSHVPVCPTCHGTVEPGPRKAYTVAELIAALQALPGPHQRHRIQLDLGPGIKADVWGVQWGDGELQGHWVTLTLGTVRFSVFQEEKST